MSGELKSLDRLGADEVGVVYSIDGGRGLVRRLSSMGLRPGVSVRLVCAQPARGPVVVEVGGMMRIALGRGMARKILIEIKKEDKE